jgi:hypothetical protein
VNLFVAILTGVLEKVKAEDKAREPGPEPRLVTWLKEQRTRLKNAERGRDDRWRIFKWTHQLVDSLPFAIVVYSLIIINFIVLSMEHYPMSPTWEQALYISNIVLNSLFSVEVILRLVGLGLYCWASDGFNIFDFFVVVGSWIELAVSRIAIVRVLRSLRMFRILSYWKSFNRILRTVGIAIKGSVFFLFLYALIIYVFAVVGFGEKKLFAETIYLFFFCPECKCLVVCSSLWTHILVGILTLFGTLQ